MNNWTLKQDSIWIKIYKRNLLHVSFKRDSFLGIQSYLIEEESNKYIYYLEIHTKELVIQTDYILLKDWKAILKLIDKI